MNLSITAHPSNPPGLVRTLSTYTLDLFTPGSAALCRNTAPLVSFAYSLLHRDIPARIIGKDIGAQLITIIKKMNATNLGDCLARLSVWHAREVNRLHDQGRDPETIDDQYSALLFFADSLDESSQRVEDLIAKIDLLFSEDTRSDAVLLMTIHRSKGLEWPRVFILDQHLIPSRHAKTPDARKQEGNLLYVAITRSQSELYYINSGQWAQPA